jgi:hypothetical protein
MNKVAVSSYPRNSISLMPVLQVRVEVYNEDKVNELYELMQARFREKIKTSECCPSYGGNS